MRICNVQFVEFGNQLRICDHLVIPGFKTAVIHPCDAEVEIRVAQESLFLIESKHIADLINVVLVNVGFHIHDDAVIDQRIDRFQETASFGVNT